MSTRDDVAAVLDGLVITAGGEACVISAYPQLPESIQPWTAWPVWVSTDWRTACIADETHTVLVTMPASGSIDTTDAIDASLWPIRDELQKLGAVPRAEPIALAVGDQAQTMPAIAFTLNT